MTRCLLPVRAVPRRLDSGPLADGDARVDHVDRGARALGARGAARARRCRRAAILVLAVSHPPPRGEGRDWKRNDQSKSNFVKNKPCTVDSVVGTGIFIRYQTGLA